MSGAILKVSLIFFIVQILEIKKKKHIFAKRNICRIFKKPNKYENL